MNGKVGSADGEGAFSRGPGYLMLPGRVAVHARIGRKGAVKYQVSRLSLTDADVVCDGPSFPHNTEVELFFVSADREIGPARATAGDAGNGAGRRNLVFVDLSLGTARELLRLAHDLLGRDMLAAPPATIAREERITDPGRIARIMRAMAGCNAAGVFIAGDLRRPIRVKGLDPNDAFPILWETDAAVPEPPFMIEVAGYNSVYRILVERNVKDGQVVKTPLPAEVALVRHRKWRRANPTDSEAVVSFRYPLWPELSITRPLHDVSQFGLAIDTNPLDDLLYPGLKVPVVEVAWNGKERLRVSAEVRHVTGVAGGPDFIAGMVVCPVDDMPWRERVDAALHPNTRRGATWSSFLWDAYEKSGYFNLAGKTPKHFSHLRKPFATASRKLDPAPHLGAQIVWPTERGIAMTVSFLREYQTAWLGFQTAKHPLNIPDGVPGKRILRDVFFHGHEHVMGDPDARWYIGYTRSDTRWPRLIHRDFAERYANTGKACLVPFRAMEGICFRPTYRCPKGIEVGPATAEETEVLLNVIKSTRPAPYCEALDYVPSRFDFSGVKGVWGEAGFTREREVYVARREGRPVTAAVFESADEGIHLFGFLNLVRIFPLVEGAGEEYTALLHSARSWYHEKGKSSFVYYLEGDIEDIDHALDANLIDLGTADLTVISTDLMPDLSEHVYENTVSSGVPRLVLHSTIR